MKYNKLRALCVEKDAVYSRMLKELNITGRTVTALKNNKSISLAVVDRICTYFNCQPSDIMELSVNELPSDSQSD